MGSHKLQGMAFGLTLVVLALGSARSALAQTTPPGQNPNEPFAGSAANGVVVDADGVLRMRSFEDPGGQLARQRIAAARNGLNPDVATPSKLRKVSLTRLERAMKKLLDQHAAVTDEMKCLAGLTRVRYVFYYPETKDIVVAGPAEGWVEDLAGRMRGMRSGRPVVELQDLIVALRSFPPRGQKAPVLLCSIDPTPEGLARMQEFLHRIGTRATPGDTEMIVNGLRTSMGMQNIRVGGVAANTHFAQVMIEADYRMKLIGIGIEKPPVRMASYVDRANPAQVSRNALQRWYFVPDYQCVRITGDDLGMELVGNGVKLVAEDQMVSQDGSRKATGRSNRASQIFTSGFTQKYAEIAARVPVYAQLRNVVDLAVAAAFIRDRDYYGKADWRMEVFGSEQAYPVETYNTPVQVETVVTSIWRGNRLMTPVGGGVTMQPTVALESSNLLQDEDGKLGEARESVSVKDLPADKWWWD